MYLSRSSERDYKTQILGKQLKVGKNWIKKTKREALCVACVFCVTVPLRTRESVRLISVQEKVLQHLHVHLKHVAVLQLRGEGVEVGCLQLLQIHRSAY